MKFVMYVLLSTLVMVGVMHFVESTDLPQYTVRNASGQ